MFLTFDHPLQVGCGLSTAIPVLLVLTFATAYCRHYKRDWIEHEAVVGLDCEIKFTVPMEGDRFCLTSQRDVVWIVSPPWCTDRHEARVTQAPDQGKHDKEMPPVIAVNHEAFNKQACECRGRHRKQSL